MAKLDWNGFLKKYGNAGVLVQGAWYGKHQKNMLPTGIELPTPYSALLKLLGKKLSGDWTARKDSVKVKRPKGAKGPLPPKPTRILVLIADPSDLAVFKDLFGLSSSVAPTSGAVSSVGYQYNYDPANYARICKELGF